MFFKEGNPYNQGNIFDFDDDDFLSACDVAIQKVKSNPVNVEGKKLQEITWDKSVDEILKHI